MSKVTHYATGSLGFPNSHTLTTIIDDISTAGSSWTSSLPFDYEIEDGYITIYGAITGADANITVEVGGTAVDGFAAVVANAGSTAGSTFTFSAPTGGPTNEAAEGDPLEIITDGASTGAVKAIVNISVRRRA
jgi:hypothetical protein